MAIKNITEALNECNPVYISSQYEVEGVSRTSPYGIHRHQEQLHEAANRAEDTYEVDHGLNKKDLRILFKILAKDLPDCGRKRGAILRYIKAYQSNEKNIAKSLQTYLDNYET